MDDYERVLLVKPDVLVYRIPPRVTNRAYRASDWNLDVPDWNCRLRLISKGNNCFIKLEEKSTGQFFGQCPIEKYPGPAIEAVSDSSRYFVLRLINEETKRTAFVGIGFVDRSDSFDMNVALQDHFKILQMEKESTEKNDDKDVPKLDLGFKEGQTIKVNLNIGKKPTGNNKTRPKASGGLGGILLPPPPGNKQAGLVTSTDAQASNKDTNSKETSSTDSTKTDSSSLSFHQQLIDGLDSLSVSSDSNTNPFIGGNSQKSSLPTLTPANSVCVEDFASFSSSNSTNSQTITASDKNKTDDLWSDFESFKSDSNPTSETKDTPSSSTNQFDNWAKF